MGRPQEGSSSYQTDQPQEFDLQPQEYQYEPTLESTHTQDDFSAQTYEGSNYYDSSQQDQYQPHFTDASETDPQAQQQQQQQYQPPQPQQQQLSQQQQPPQANQGYGAQPARPSQFPPQSSQTNPTYPSGPNRPAPYPPQDPQTFPAQPTQFPPQSPSQPAAYPPAGPQTISAQPVQFPPQRPNQPAAYPPQGPQTVSTQPVQFPPPNPQNNLMYPGGPTKPVAFPPQGPQQFPGQPSPGTYPPQPQAVPFPPKSPTQGYDMPTFPPKPAAQGIPVQVNQFQQQQPVVYNENWQTGLFDCMDDPTNALITACFPCVTFGQVAEIVDNGQTSCGTSGMLYGMIAFCIAMPCIISCSYRTKLRAKYGLVEAPAPDWITHCLFEWCALCQEYRELQRRGLDPAIGWQGNVARQSMQQPQVGMVPPMNQRMMA